MSVIEPAPWWPMIGMPLISAMSTALPERVLGDVAALREVAVAAAQRGDGRLRGRWRRGTPASPARAGRSCRRGCRARPHVVDLDARVGQHAALRAPPCSSAGSGRSTGLRVAAEERVLAARAVERGRLEQLPAVEDRLRVDARRAAAGGADLEAHVRGAALRRAADAAEHRAGDDACRAQRLSAARRARRRAGRSFGGERRRVGSAARRGARELVRSPLRGAPRRAGRRVRGDGALWSRSRRPSQRSGCAATGSVSGRDVLAARRPVERRATASLRCP